MSHKILDSSPPENYELYFVPAIGRPLAEELVRRANIHPGEKVLDVACGTGIAARLASKLVVPGGAVAGLDANPGMLAVARAIDAGDTPIDWYEASAEAMPLPDEDYDVVLCQMGLQFMENKGVALREMRRILKPGGRLLLNVPGPRAELFARLAKAMEHNISDQAAAFVNHVFSLHDRKELNVLLSEAGFDKIEIRTDTRTLHLPAPKDFLWQYVSSTPLAMVLSEADEASHLNLENEVVRLWQDFTGNGGMTYGQPMVTVSARK